MWTPFPKRLAESRIALLTSAGIYLRASQPPFDLDREQSHPDWGDPTWRSLPSTMTPEDIGVAHLHINDDDIHLDPEVALPAVLLAQLAVDGVIGGAAGSHVAVMGYQDRALEDWRDRTAPEIVANLRDRGVDGLILAPA